MKKNKMMRIASVLLVAVLLSTCAISGTFAKYASSVTGAATATVAKWSFKVNETEIAVTGTPSATFNLFDTNTQFDEADDDVVKGKIAPGTQGSFQYKVQNTSQVSAKYTISFTATFPTGLDNTRFKFYSDSAMNNEITLADGKYTVANGVEIEAGDSAEKTVTVYWKWDFGADKDDTALGILAQNGTTVVTVDSTIAVEQVD
jgi:hypothetical protein